MEWRGEGAKKKGSAITQAAGHNKQTISSVRGASGAMEGGQIRLRSGELLLVCFFHRETVVQV